MFQQVRANGLEINRNIGSLSKKKKDIKKNQMET